MPIDRALTLRNAEKLIRQGKLDAGIAEYLRIVEDSPGDWNAKNTLGDLYARAGQTEKAIEQFTEIADNLSEESIAALRARWRMTGERGDGRVIGTAQHRVGADVFTWDLRRIGPSVAWCLDVTVDLAGAGDDTIGPVLRELTSRMRWHGMVPVTVERFS